MSLVQLLMPFLMEFFMLNKKDTTGINSQVQLMNVVTTVVKKEISSLILKIAAALVATSLMIYSLIVLAQYAHAYFLIYQDGPAFAVIFFAAIVILSSVALYMLFGEKKKITKVFAPQTSIAHDFSVEKVFANFMEGLTEGMSQPRPERTRPAPQAHSHVEPAHMKAEPSFGHTNAYTDKFSDIT